MLIFNKHGLLSPGEYPITLTELADSVLVSGPPRARASWDRKWRATLVDNLTTLVIQLWSVGITEIFINGSFVEEKDHPNDIDGYFVCDLFALEDLKIELSELDSCWTWEPRLRKPYRGKPRSQLPMWHKYRVELYPHCGQLTGIRDEFGNDQQFPAIFRKTRSYPPIQKGIVKIVKKGDGI